MRTNLLTRIEAWLNSPAGRDETAELFMDIASAIEDGSLITPAPPPTTLGLRLQQVLGLIQERPGISTRELATALSLKIGNIAAAASRLRKAGLIRSEQGRAYAPRSVHYYAQEIKA